MPLTLSPHDFADRWRINRNKERSASQEHFIDLCRMLGVPTPNEGDPTGASYAFEKGANKQLGGQGWADVWKRGCFAWEYKGRHADLDKAYRQLQQYRESLQNPPLLITCDLERIIVHTNITSSVKQVFEITLDDIEANAWVSSLTPTLSQREREQAVKPLTLLRLIFNEVPADQHPLRSPETTEKVTQKAAQLFGQIAREMQAYGEQPQATAHFLIRVLFCLFAEDIGLLPRHLMRDMIEASGMKSSAMARRMKQLFAAMRDGGPFGNADIKHFNGGLFDDDDVLELTGNALLTLREVSGLDWGAIEPSIFGTLFERGLDPAKRSQLGAHYTSRDDIQLIVQPVLMAPLRREWDAVQAQVRDLAAHLPSPLRGGVGGGVADEGHALHTRAEHKQLAAVNDLIVTFHNALARTTVLDPACGSGNFLYVALRELLTLEKEVITFCDALGLPRPALKVSPAQLFGIELNQYAHELAQATVWIGYIQWRNENGFGFPDEPILRKLDNIQNKDAILSLPLPQRGEAARSAGEGESTQAGTPSPQPSPPRGEGAEPTWPAADVIIGNPPFLGGNRIRKELGDAYVDALFKLYDGRMPAFADLVCYWFEKARAMVEQSKTKRAGLLATQAIRGGANRRALDRVKETGDIFFAWADRDWILDGATVHVSIVAFDSGIEKIRQLDGKKVTVINADLTATTDLTVAHALAENANVAFIGDTKKGKFDISNDVAQRMLAAQNNPNGRPNSDVIRPWINGIDITQNARDMWIIDFGVDLAEEGASQYEHPFEYVRLHVKPERDRVRNPSEKKNWWLHGRTASDFRKAVVGLKRYIATPRVAKHRLFVFISSETLPDGQVVAFTREDEYFLGVLHSKHHELWARSMGTQLREAESGFRYSQTLTFETFPFPWPPGHEPTDDPRVQVIAQAAKELVEKRDRWLAEAPATTEVDPAYLTGLNAAKKKPKKSEARTLTNLYNQRPTWLDLAHKKLDAAVADAYGWPRDLSDEEILARLLALNLERAGKVIGA
jgi:hypothetical protein